MAYEPWPEADEALLVVDTIKLPVQVRRAFKAFEARHIFRSIRGCRKIIGISLLVLQGE